MFTQQIISRFNSNNVLFECELPDSVENRLAMRHAVERAIAEQRTMSDADLRGADLIGAIHSLT